MCHVYSLPVSLKHTGRNVFLNLKSRKRKWTSSSVGLAGFIHAQRPPLERRCWPSADAAAPTEGAVGHSTLRSPGVPPLFEGEEERIFPLLITSTTPFKWNHQVFTGAEESAACRLILAVKILPNIEACTRKYATV